MIKNKEIIESCDFCGGIGLARQSGKTAQGDR
jgi:hypothetical protein